MAATSTPETRPFTILLVEDSPVQQALTRRAMEDSTLEADLRVVDDGEAALQYLRGEGEFAGAPRPDIILLDLNMPRMDGHTMLEKLRSDPKLAGIPVTVLTTSTADADVSASYARGANAFVTKPAEYEKFVELLSALGQFWAHFVRRPG
ncbi:MAG: response regulator [Planctomycetes bacterium]|nr:response regulator [Planctomycetota bacterium]MCW8136662.1 response regulator [Planctomycetota bacterium]